MSVYIASKKMRGAWAQKHVGSITVDVTSAQRIESPYRRDFSPMVEVKGRYKGFYCFENYWQSGKVYEDIGQPVNWWLQLDEPKRRYPAKGKHVLHAIFDGRKMDYVTSRKLVYVPEYYNLVKNREMISQLKELVAKGKSITIYDFDGPKLPDGSNDILQVTEELLREKINDITYPFGHGYIVAGIIAGITPDKYID